MKKDEATSRLFEAARLGNVANVQAALDAGGDVNSRETHTQATPLHWASAYGNQEAVKSLIANGADVNAKDAHGGTPTHWASASDHKKVVKLLADAIDQQQSHTGRVTKGRKDQGPPQVGS